MVHEQLEYDHRNGCAVVAVASVPRVPRVPETDWRIDIKPLGVAQ
jgi:hypothetical protein